MTGDFATHLGSLPIVGMEIPCAVLSNGLRVLSQRGFYGVIGGTRPKGQGQDERVDDMPPFLAARNLQPFISDTLRAPSGTKIAYRFDHIDDGGRTRGSSLAHGIDARLIPEICDVYLKAREAGALQTTQAHIAKSAEILMRGLARVGIIALVDEATGYQADRDREELAKILEAYSSRRKW